jgi:two-component system, chemotaxis family, sensor histidine kinase and response regulator WspE
MEAVDPMMLALFSEELRTRSEALSAGLLSLEKNPENGDVITQIMREAHSLKGAARMMSISTIERLMHLAEDGFSAIKTDPKNAANLPFDSYFAICDWLKEASKIDSAQLFSWIEQQKVYIENLIAQLDQSKPNTSVVFSAVTEVKTEDKFLRVGTEGMKMVLSKAAQANVSLIRFSELKTSLSDFKISFDRSVADYGLLEDFLASQDLPDGVRLLVAQTRNRLLGASSFLRQFSLDVGHVFESNDVRIQGVYQDLLDMRLRPLSELIVGFPRLIRDLEKSLNKTIHFEVEGADTRVDRDILSELEAPLLHLIRNAADHGIESPAERVASEKTPEGHINLKAQARSGMFELEISDDGRGIDIEFIRKDIVVRGLIPEAEASVLTEVQCFDFLFLPGYSTAQKVTEISGRGVGLDTVKAFVKKMGGSVQLRTEVGKGSAFTLRLPITRLLTDCLIFKLENQLYGIAGHYVESIRKINHKKEVPCLQSFLWGGETACTIELDLKIGEQRLTVGVSSLMDVLPLVLEPLNSSWGEIRGISALTVLPDGQLAAVLDSNFLVQKMNAASKVRLLETVSTLPVMIVDDSDATLESHRKMLVERGYTVIMAKDGKEALAALEKRQAQAVITDLDMPNMDGLNLILNIRGNKRLSKLPILVVSTSDYLREKSLQAGADIFLNKEGSCESSAELLDALQQVLAKKSKT